MPPPRLTSTIPDSETSSHTLCSVGKWGVLGLSHIRRLPLIGFLTRAFPANRRLNRAGSLGHYHCTRSFSSQINDRSLAGEDSVVRKSDGGGVTLRANRFQAPIGWL